MNTLSPSSSGTVPEPLRSPDAHAPLALHGDQIVDAEGGSVGRCLGPVWFGQRYRMIGMDLSQQALRLAALTRTARISGTQACASTAKSFTSARRC